METGTMFVPNHLHVVIKAYVSNPPRKVEDVSDWLSRLVEKVGMVVVAGPTSVRVDEPGNEGCTGTVTLSTSHASIHIWDAGSPALIQFDLYSCKKFEVESVREHLNEFGIVEGTFLLLDRNGAKAETLGIGQL